MRRVETPEEVIQIFKQWEYAASRSPNPNVSRAAPLEPPTLDEAAALLLRLGEIDAELANRSLDWHNRPIGDRGQAAMGYLWEEWRHGVLGVWNGYRDVWTKIDPLYDSPEGSKKLLPET